MPQPTSGAPIDGISTTAVRADTSSAAAKYNGSSAFRPSIVKVESRKEIAYKDSMLAAVGLISFTLWRKIPRGFKSKHCRLKIVFKLTLEVSKRWYNARLSICYKLAFTP